MKRTPLLKARSWLANRWLGQRKEFLNDNRGRVTALHLGYRSLFDAERDCDPRRRVPNSNATLKTINMNMGQSWA
jgi:hypothetical protein